MKQYKVLGKDNITVVTNTTAIIIMLFSLGKVLASWKCIPGKEGLEPREKGRQP